MSTSETCTILLVEQDPALRHWLGRQWPAETLITAANARHAVQLAASHQPRAVLLGDGLPDLSGQAAVLAIRQAAPAARLLLLAMTGAHATQLAAGEHGVAAWVATPVLGAELTQALRRLLPEGPGRAAPNHPA